MAQLQTQDDDTRSAITYLSDAAKETSFKQDSGSPAKDSAKNGQSQQPCTKANSKNAAASGQAQLQQSK